MVEVSSKTYQLIYAGKEIEKLITEAYPQAKITDASDYIHTERFECEIDIPEDEFYIFAIRQGFANCCLAFQMMMMHDRPRGSLQKLWDLFAEARALDESEGKNE